MSQANLGTYLNDHLAGSVLALELLEHLEKSNARTELKFLLARLRVDILADQKELETLMKFLGVSTSLPRKAMAWLAEKFTEAKLMLEDSSRGPFHQLEAIEAIAIGIDGKRALWRSLATAGISGPDDIDYKRLEKRAEEQRDRIEQARLEAAKLALGSNR